MKDLGTFNLSPPYLQTFLGCHSSPPVLPTLRISEKKLGMDASIIEGTKIGFVLRKSKVLGTLYHL